MYKAAFDSRRGGVPVQDPDTSLPWDVVSRLKVRFGFFVFSCLVPQSYNSKMKVNSLEEVQAQL